MARTTLIALAGQKSTGEAVHEELLVETEPGGFRLIATPGLVLGVAAGDLVEVGADGSVSVIERGGNLAIQLYGEHSWADEVAGEFGDRGVRIDARAPRLTVLTVPMRVGFPALEAALAAWTSRHQGAEWYYGNVYGPDGETPLNWWL